MNRLFVLFLSLAALARGFWPKRFLAGYKPAIAFFWPEPRVTTLSPAFLPNPTAAPLSGVVFA